MVRLHVYRGVVHMFRVIENIVLHIHIRPTQERYNQGMRIFIETLVSILTCQNCLTIPKYNTVYRNHSKVLIFSIGVIKIPAYILPWKGVPQGYISPSVRMHGVIQHYHTICVDCTGNQYFNKTCITAAVLLCCCSALFCMCIINI